MPLRKPSPRVNVVVTLEQQALLLELARLDPDTRSASGFLRQLLDEVTPLLRITVPMMRAAAEELDSSREGLRGPLRDFLGRLEQMDLLETPHGAPRPQPRSGEDGRTARRTRRKP
jgi:hypothetical protein